MSQGLEKYDSETAAAQPSKDIAAIDDNKSPGAAAW
jgi:hypothetical protein